MITVQNKDKVAGSTVEVTVDGQPRPDGGIQLIDDGERHEVTVQRVGEGARQTEELVADDRT